jgi:aspartate-semialdehyde dehydrogenase
VRVVASILDATSDDRTAYAGPGEGEPGAALVVEESTVVGRVREDRALPNGVKFVLLSHNTKMGAAKGALLVAEWLVHGGLA